MSSSRAICDGDRARSGLGDHRDDLSAIRRTMGRWTTERLKKFLPIAKSDAWRKEAHHLIMARTGVMAGLAELKAKRESRRKKRVKAKPTRLASL